MDGFDEEIVRPDIRDPQERARLGLPHFPISGGAPATLKGEDDSYWWGGVFLRTIVPKIVAANLAAIALSASLAWGYQQQTDEIVPFIPPPPDTVGEDYGPRVVVIETPQVLQLWISDGAASAPIPALAPDEDAWHPLTPRPVLSTSWVWTVDDEIAPQPAPQVVEEEPWLVYSPPYQPAHPLYLPDVEELPAGSLFGQPDEDFWRVYTPPYAPARFVYLPEPEEIPANALFGQPDEDYWAVRTPPYAPARFVYLPDPEEIPAGALFGVPEEDFWQPLAAQPTLRATWVWAVDDEIVSQPPTFAPDEDYWLSRVPPVTPPVVWPWAMDDEIVPQVAAFVPDEDYWRAVAPSVFVARQLYLPDPKELPDDFPLIIDDYNQWYYNYHA